VRNILHPAAIAAGADPCDAELLECDATPIVGSTGAATAEVTRLAGLVRTGARELPFTMVRKTFRPMTSGRHAAAAREQTHWAYWRRELLAYATKAVPSGPHLTAPRCFGVTDDAVYLQDVTGPTESAATAATRLGAWQARTPLPDVPWLGGHQLAQRIAVSSLDWSGINAPESLRAVWDRRDALLAVVESVPVVICHGDFHVRNLIAGRDTTTVLDWGTLGAGPVGADLAHLALSTGDDVLDAYLDGLGDRFDLEAVLRGYYITMALTATSRVHWMLSRDTPIPPTYISSAASAIDHLSI
jgi:hypothetical protein